jgi:hypothetical protein
MTFDDARFVSKRFRTEYENALIELDGKEFLSRKTRDVFCFGLKQIPDGKAVQWILLIHSTGSWINPGQRQDLKVYLQEKLPLALKSKVIPPKVQLFEEIASGPLGEILLSAGAKGWLINKRSFQFEVQGTISKEEFFQRIGSKIPREMLSYSDDWSSVQTH